ncbi:DUF72 domain-containing protein, partial [bacterium]|nr:DUF72 domain-containing protein [bacterium]
MVHRGRNNQGDLFGDDSRQAPRHPKRLGREGRIRVGTSGYSFADWIGPFYPARTPRSKMLDEYIRHFDVVEINSSYYRIPTVSMFERMEQKTPEGFEFIVKLFRGMTHEIEDNPQMYSEFVDSIAPLKEAGKFGGFLAQFPWKFRNCADGRAHLAALRKRLGEDPLFVEFRHDSWIEDDTFTFLGD